MFENSKFSIEQALRYGWEKTKLHLNFFLLFLVCLFFVMLLLKMFAVGNEFTKNISTVLGFIFNLMVAIGVNKTVLRIINEELPTLDDFFLRDFAQVISFVAAVLLYIIIVLIGTILLVVPGIILALRLRFYTFLILERNLTPVEALRESFRITKGQTWPLLFFTCIAGLLNLAAVFLAGLGLIFTIPMTVIATGFIYRTLSYRSDKETIPPQVPHTSSDASGHSAHKKHHTTHKN